MPQVHKDQRNNTGTKQIRCTNPFRFRLWYSGRDGIQRTIRPYRRPVDDLSGLSGLGACHHQHSMINRVAEKLDGGRLGACHHHIELCFGGVELVISGNIHCRCQVDSVYAFRPMASSTSR